MQGNWTCAWRTIHYGFWCKWFLILKAWSGLFFQSRLFSPSPVMVYILGSPKNKLYFSSLNQNLTRTRFDLSIALELWLLYLEIENVQNYTNSFRKINGPIHARVKIRWDFLMKWSAIKKPRGTEFWSSRIFSNRLGNLSLSESGPATVNSSSISLCLFNILQFL